MTKIRTFYKILLFIALIFAHVIEAHGQKFVVFQDNFERDNDNNLGTLWAEAEELKSEMALADGGAILVMQPSVTPPAQCTIS